MNKNPNRADLNDYASFAVLLILLFLVTVAILWVAR